MFWSKDKIPNLKEERDEDLFTIEEDNEIEDSVNEEEIKPVIKKEKFHLKKLNIHNESDIKLLNKIINIILIIIIILGIFISVDVITVSRTGNGPYFAIKTKTYNDGGTKVYYGLGYKVIKYNVDEGRKDSVIGSWNLAYDKKPLKTNMLDIALDFNNDLSSSITTYMDKYLQVEGTIKEITNNKIILIYKDEENKYTTTLTCNLLSNESNYKKKDTVRIVGTLYNYEKSNNLSLYMKNCYLK